MYAVSHAGWQEDKHKVVVVFRIPISWRRRYYSNYDKQGLWNPVADSIYVVRRKEIQLLSDKERASSVELYRFGYRMAVRKIAFRMPEV